MYPLFDEIEENLAAQPINGEKPCHSYPEKLNLKKTIRVTVLPKKYCNNCHGFNGRNSLDHQTKNIKLLSWGFFGRGRGILDFSEINETSVKNKDVAFEYFWHKNIPLYFEAQLCYWE